jgi:hypothetical protein
VGGIEGPPRCDLVHPPTPPPGARAGAARSACSPRGTGSAGTARPWRPRGYRRGLRLRGTKGGVRLGRGLRAPAQYHEAADEPRGVGAAPPVLAGDVNKLLARVGLELVLRCQGGRFTFPSASPKNGSQSRFDSMQGVCRIMPPEVCSSGTIAPDLGGRNRCKTLHI